MNLEEEKKLVAEKLMGWKVKYQKPRGWLVKAHIITKQDGSKLQFVKWNPQSERKWWDDIWDKFTWVMIREYDKHLVEMAYENAFPTATGGFGEETPLALRWKAHTAKPEVCWKALIKTLEDK